jgi:hypothetical protein
MTLPRARKPPAEMTTDEILSRMRALLGQLTEQLTEKRPGSAS